MLFFKSKQKLSKIEQELDPSNFSSVQTAIGFSVLGLVGALLFSVTMGDDFEKIASIFPSDDNQDMGIDRTIVGSISKSGSKKGKVKRYTVRQSVLQSRGSALCIIQADGSQKGDC
ncbi:MAG: hypothetical protein V3V02_07385 [Rhizobiaceae bacterium]